MAIKGKCLLVLLLLAVSNGCTQRDIGDNNLDDSFSPKTVKLIDAIILKDYNLASNNLELGANINEVGVDGVSPLIWVLALTQEIEQLEFMLKHGADVNYRGYGVGKSPMFFAAAGKRGDILELFLKYGGNPNLEGDSEEGQGMRRSIFMVAIEFFNEQHFDLLLEYGADVNWNIDGIYGYERVPFSAITVGRYDWALRLVKLGYEGDPNELLKVSNSRLVSEKRQPDKDKFIKYVEEELINNQTHIDSHN